MYVYLLKRENVVIHTQRYEKLDELGKYMVLCIDGPFSLVHRSWSLTLSVLTVSIVATCSSPLHSKTDCSHVSHSQHF